MNFDFENGEILLVNKPFGWTSYDVVNKLKWTIRKKLAIKKLKIGHGGTLDPLASGLMVIATGRMTKKLEEFQSEGKEYVAEITLGATTPSFDMETQIDQEFPTDQIDIEMIKSVLASMVGPINQIPPLFSAKRISGKRAYKLARNDAEIELKPVPIVIKSLELIDYQHPVLQIRVSCSKGTYIRSLARDIGLALHSGAFLSGLVRTASGNFLLKNAINPEELEAMINQAEVALK
jgi:tRNA pseudouridine55 synthase